LRGYPEYQVGRRVELAVLSRPTKAVRGSDAGSDDSESGTSHG
jgi:hypothetical protein